MSQNVYNNWHRVSKLFQPLNIPQKNAPVVKTEFSKSYKHMIDTGIISKCNTGMYALLPLGYRILEKLTSIIDNELLKIDAQKILLPALSSQKLWKKTNRFEEAGRELFTLCDKHDTSYVLSPTHEETITDVISKVGPISPKTLPLRLYQISSKWRDEMKPRLGFMRSREFIMKDLYTFDIGSTQALETYKIVNHAYDNIFNKIGIQYKKAIGSVGMIGGTVSHEYHYITEIGEDVVLSCLQCNYHINKNATDESTCPSCKNAFSESTTAEIGHTFFLGTKYSETLKALYKENHTTAPLSMGCYGIGMTRLIASAAEVLSTEQELRWPIALAPYTVCVIPPKKNSKEDVASQYNEKICELLSQSNIDFIIDDRTHLTIGQRFIYSRKCGFPYVIVIGKLALNSDPLFELHDINNSTHNDVGLETLFDFFNQTINQQKISNRATV
ncbi:probable proline--tRNA ligase, mitochondrial [Leptopilina heterotoma]|uniref:probable proline--tRNA ligase, mitochondrial n=1 Tax=Leptopilina heterotoma TaxID=63436 RepID=UPI001CA94F82|nr:probable proline--tRNA ligase, mitochondrial [Leptopilina heterotoma]